MDYFWKKGGTHLQTPTWIQPCMLPMLFIQCHTYIRQIHRLTYSLIYSLLRWATSSTFFCKVYVTWSGKTFHLAVLYILRQGIFVYNITKRNHCSIDWWWWFDATTHLPLADRSPHMGQIMQYASTWRLKCERTQEHLLCIFYPLW